MCARCILPSPEVMRESSWRRHATLEFHIHQVRDREMMLSLYDSTVDFLSNSSILDTGTTVLEDVHDYGSSEHFCDTVRCGRDAECGPIPSIMTV